MKTLTLIAFALITTSSFANSVPAACSSKAATAVEKSAERNRYDRGGFETVECEVAENKGAVICEVAASKGEGAAYDTYRVVLNKTCTRVFRVELTGEE